MTESSFQTKIKQNPFRRTDLEIEIEVKNAQRNWKKGKISNEDFQKILKTMRHRESDVLDCYAEDQKTKDENLNILKDLSEKQSDAIKRLLEEKKLRKQKLQQLFSNFDLEQQINENPKMFKFLDTPTKKNTYIDGYNYAIREVLIRLKKFEDLLKE